MSLRLIIAAGLLAVTSLAMPPPAMADEGYMRSSGTLRTGPTTGHRGILRLQRGRDVWIYGCLQNQRWCDITTGSRRGWMQASRLGTYRRGARMQHFDARQLLSLSILVFGQRRPESWRDGSHYDRRRGAPLIIDRQDRRDRRPYFIDEGDRMRRFPLN